MCSEPTLCGVGLQALTVDGQEFYLSILVYVYHARDVSSGSGPLKQLVALQHLSFVAETMGGTFSFPNSLRGQMLAELFR